MKIYYTSEDHLSEAANELIEFDVGSIRRVVAADGGDEPDLWLVAPGGYQTNGHPQRDSESIRLIAYSKLSGIVYATDGCNACRHVLDTSLETTRDEKLITLSEQTQLPHTLLQALARLIRN